jgi:BTB/POZ domain
VVVKLFIQLSVVVVANCCNIGGRGGGATNSPSAVRMTDRITLVVDDTRFVVEPDIFRQFPDTMLGRCVPFLVYTAE